MAIKIDLLGYRVRAAEVLKQHNEAELELKVAVLARDIDWNTVHRLRLVEPESNHQTAVMKAIESDELVSEIRGKVATTTYSVSDHLTKLMSRE